MAVLWRGDFSTGDLRQWTGVESVAPADRLQVVDAPLRPGKALRVRVKPGDLIQNGVRNEVWWKGKDPPGAERWYRWGTLFPDTLPVSREWQVWAQWHQSYRPDGTTVGDVPPVALAVRRDRLCLVCDGSDRPDHELWSAPVPRGVWLDVAFHARWSEDPAVGFVHLIINGIEVVPRTSLWTIPPGLGLPNYLKLGLYRSREIQPEATIYHQGMTVYDAAEDDVPLALAHELPLASPVTSAASPSPELPALAIRDASGRRWRLSLSPDGAT